MKPYALVLLLVICGCGQSHQDQKPKVDYLVCRDVVNDVVRNMGRGAWWDADKQILIVSLKPTDTSRTEVKRVLAVVMKRLKANDIEFDVESIERAVAYAEKLTQERQKELDGYRKIKP